MVYTKEFPFSFSGSKDRSFFPSSAKQLTFSLSLNFSLSFFDIWFTFIFHEALYFTFNWYIQKHVRLVTLSIILAELIII